MSAAALIVHRSGVLLTVQDLGRPGLAALGVSPSGALDRAAAAAANRLAGNPPEAALLEVTGAGAVLELDGTGARRLALTGADLGASAPLDAAFQLAPGGRVTFDRRVRGARAYLAIAGGLVTPPVLGSRATDLGAFIGGVDGRPLRAGVRLPIGAAPSSPAPPAAPAPVARAHDAASPLRFLPRPTAPLAAVDALAASRLHVDPRSSRIALRFAGPALAVAGAAEIVSEPLGPYAIQLLPEGLPMVLLADGPLTGGYPVIGHVIEADVSRLAQLWAGDAVGFRAVSRAEARAARPSPA
jgi:biotin-dependent carboxylase-like uncharacterized protein